VAVIIVAGNFLIIVGRTLEYFVLTRLQYEFVVCVEQRLVRKCGAVGGGTEALIQVKQLLSLTLVELGYLAAIPKVIAKVKNEVRAALRVNVPHVAVFVVGNLLD
jgi:hypothetical protein